MKIHWPYWLGAGVLIVVLAAVKAHFIFAVIVGALWMAISVRHGWIERDSR